MALAFMESFESTPSKILENWNASRKKHHFRPKANGERECTRCEKTIRYDGKAWITVKGTWLGHCAAPPPGEYFEPEEVSVGAVLQPHYSGTCGQVAVANIAGISFKESCRIFGHKGGTQSSEVIAALQSLGWTFPNGSKMVRVRPQLGVANVVNHPKKKSWHWMAVINGQLVNGYEYTKIGCRAAWYLECEKGVS